MLLVADRHAAGVFRAVAISAVATVMVLSTGLWLLRSPVTAHDVQEFEPFPPVFPAAILTDEPFRNLRDIPDRPSVTDPTGSLNLAP